MGLTNIIRHVYEIKPVLSKKKKSTVKYFLFVGIQFSSFSWIASPTNLETHELKYTKTIL